MRIPRPMSPRRVAILGLVAGVLVSGGYLVVQAPSAPALPKVSPARLLASTLRALEQPYSLSGRISGQFHVAGSVGGNRGRALVQTNYRIWRSPGGLRVAEVLDTGERLLVMNPNAAWLWNSSTLSATKFPANALTSKGFDFTPAFVADPLAFVTTVLHTLAPYSDITISSTATIAGRGAYLLSLTSTQSYSLLRRVVIGIDAKTRLPLMIGLYKHENGAPAAQVGFTSISFGSVSPSLFQFSPPSGATVNKVTVFAGGGSGALTSSTRTVGKGWKTIVIWQLSHAFTKQALGAFPIYSSIGSALTVRAHGKTWLLAGFVHPLRLQRLALHLSH